jgi:hypothetical protein
MTDDRRNESRELAKPSLAQRDLAEGRWRGVNFYEMTAGSACWSDPRSAPGIS